MGATEWLFILKRCLILVVIIQRVSLRESLVTMRATTWLFILKRCFILVVIIQRVSAWISCHNCRTWMAFNHDKVFQTGGHHVALSEGLSAWISCHNGSTWMAFYHDKVFQSSGHYVTLSEGVFVWISCHSWRSWMNGFSSWQGVSNCGHYVSLSEGLFAWKSCNNGSSWIAFHHWCVTCWGVKSSFRGSLRESLVLIAGPECLNHGKVFQTGGHHVALSEGLSAWISCHNGSTWMAFHHDKVFQISGHYVTLSE